MTTKVWAFCPIPELNKATGLVDCEEELAAQLISDGRVQDPRIGANLFKPIEDAPPPRPRPEQDYNDKAMTPRRRR
jgi:hypothetical protein